MTDKHLAAFAQGLGIGLALASLAGAFGGQPALSLAALVGLVVMGASYVLEKQAERPPAGTIEETDK